jgi:hypothetical protein
MPSILTSYASTLTPLQLTAGAELLQNHGLRVNPSVTAEIAAYTSTPLIGSFITVQTEAKAGVGNLANTTIQTLANLASNTCGALSDSQPQYYLNLNTFGGGVPYPPGLTGIIGTKANLYLGSPTGTANNWDTSRFCQIFSACESYATLANQFIISSCNANKYLCDTFTNQDNSITGDITKVNLATGAFGQDLKNLGQLWDLANLDNLGSPLALVQRLYSVTGTFPALSLTFIAEGVPSEAVVNLDNPTASITDTAQRALYVAMTKVTGNLLAQVLQIFKVTTTGIETMADLLNPYKLFPLSFQSLTTPTTVGSRAIYTNSTGSVNTNLVQILPPYVLSSTV